MSLYSKDILENLDFTDLEGISFNPEITNKDPGENLVLRPLARDDFSRGMFQFWYWWFLKLNVSTLSYTVVPVCLTQVNNINNIMSQ